MSIKPEDRKQGIVAISGGNHALAAAYVARTLDTQAFILMPESTPRNYVEATRGYGAEIKIAATAAAAFAEAAEMEDQGWVFIHPFDDPLVMAGQGTVGLEILEDVPQVTDIIVSIGGGGFAGGVATVVKSLKPAVRIWGVETQGADCMAKSLAAGGVETLEAITSIARTLGAAAPSEQTLALARQFLEKVVVVPDGEAASALLFLLERLKVLAEPAASCTLAAADRLREQFTPERHLVLVLSGGNFAMEDLAKLQA